MNGMTMRLVRDAAGVTRHVPARFGHTAPPAKGKKKLTPPDPIRTNGDSAAEQLRLFVERIETINAEIAAGMQDRADVFAEAKGVGYDVKGIRAILALRQQEKHLRDEHDAIMETYRTALGML